LPLAASPSSAATSLEVAHATTGGCFREMTPRAYGQTTGERSEIRTERPGGRHPRLVVGWCERTARDPPRTHTHETKPYSPPPPRAAARRRDGVVRGAWNARSPPHLNALTSRRLTVDALSVTSSRWCALCRGCHCLVGASRRFGASLRASALLSALRRFSRRFGASSRAPRACDHALRCARRGDARPQKARRDLPPARRLVSFELLGAPSRGVLQC
jgi:hypothetical protein